MFKIMNGLVRVDKEKLFSPTKTPHTRGHPRGISGTKHNINVVLTEFTSTGLTFVV